MKTRKMFEGIGSYSSGSLLMADLVPAAIDAAWAVQRFTGSKKDHDAVATFAGSWDKIEGDMDSESGGEEGEDAAALYEEIADFVSGRLPTGLYFGSLEGDGADVGIFPCDPSDSDLPRVSDAVELVSLPLDVSEAYVVNDHGNVTLMAKHGKEWAPVWDCV